ncbi:MAG: hypothetical protein A2Z57_02640, partial [Planctomycetes bacterium RIFCSPHIGHO2_12_39_6]
NTNHQYLILTTLKGKDVFYFQHPNFTFLSFRMASRNPLLRILWEQLILPFILKKEGVDVLFSPGNICPLFSKLPNVIMVQNIEPFSDDLSRGRGLIQRIRLKLLKILTMISIKKAQRVIFPSMKARTLTEKSGTLMHHVEVIHYGIDKGIFHPGIEDNISLQFKKKYGLDKFILYVSHIQRYKNFFELIKAFVLLKDKIGNDIQLVFAGRCFDEEYYKEMQDFIREHRYEDRIIFLGNVPYEELPFLYSACMIFVYPSICESFGMTLVEAMACGAPILASKVEPMVEICADAAVYFNPTNPAAIADIILKALKDRNLISQLKINSLKRAKIFSWENTAIRMLKIFESVV